MKDSVRISIHCLTFVILKTFISAIDTRCRISLLSGQDRVIGNIRPTWSSSSYLLSNGMDYSPSRARMDFDLDTELMTPWKAAILDKNQYIQVDLGFDAVVGGIVTVGCDSINALNFCDEYVTQYMLQYSEDGVQWDTVSVGGHNTIFYGNTDAHQLVPRELDCPIIARFIRIVPIDWHNHITLKFDVLGCKLATTDIDSPTFGSHHITTPTSFTSSTRATPAPSVTLTTSAPSTATSTHVCIGNSDNFPCRGMPDGDYKHCSSCSLFVRCNKNKITELKCPDLQLWDDNMKQCVDTSTTCAPTSVLQQVSTIPSLSTTNHVGMQKSCISNVNKWACLGIPDGDYTHCVTCTKFIRCTLYRMEEIACPDKLLWDEKKKMCTDKPTTCKSTTSSVLHHSPAVVESTTSLISALLHQTPETAALASALVSIKPPTTCIGRLGNVFKSCQRMPDGNYQHCSSCKKFVRCYIYNLSEFSCPDDLVWDDNAKGCRITSTTCK